MVIYLLKTLFFFNVTQRLLKSWNLKEFPMKVELSNASM